MNRQGNGNKNYNEISSQKVLASKTYQITSVSKDMGKKAYMCTAGGNANWCNHYGDFSKN